MKKAIVTAKAVLEKNLKHYFDDASTQCLIDNQIYLMQSNADGR